MHCNFDFEYEERQRAMCHCINIEKINPLKRKEVSAIISQIEDDSFLEKIIIFGSAVRNDCRKDSDLDIAIQWTENCFDEDYILKPFTLPIFNIISRVTQGNNDVVCIGYEGDLKDSISKGVVVYNRNNLDTQENNERE